MKGSSNFMAESDFRQYYSPTPKDPSKSILFCLSPLSLPPRQWCHLPCGLLIPLPLPWLQASHPLPANRPPSSSSTTTHTLAARVLLLRQKPHLIPWLTNLQWFATPCWMKPKQNSVGFPNCSNIPYKAYLYPLPSTLCSDRPDISLLPQKHHGPS